MTNLNSILRAADRTTVTENNFELLDESNAFPLAGTITINNGEDTGSVTGLALGVAPVAVLLTVEMPTGETVLTAVLDDPPTTDGFDIKLSDVTPAAGYKVHYLVIRA